MNVTEMAVDGVSPQQWFAWAGQLAMFGWVVLVFLPRRVKLLFYVPQYVIPFALGLLYSALVLTNFFTSAGGFDSLQSVSLLFQDEKMLLGGWIHYLAFDLFIGSWIATQADAIGLSRLIQAPILIATFLFGPLGLVLFLSIRAAVSNEVVGQHA